MDQLENMEQDKKAKTDLTDRSRSVQERQTLGKHRYTYVGVGKEKVEGCW